LKKLYLLFLAVMTIFVFTACDNGQNPENSNENIPPEINDTPGVPSVFSFKMGEVNIEMDEDISAIIGKLGEPLGILEQPSCAFDGTDRIFSYPGVQIYTYPKGDADHIHTIGFFDDSVFTTEGKIRLGSNIQAAIDAYGNDYKYETGMYTFTRGLTFLEFLVDDDIIIGITYRLHLDL